MALTDVQMLAIGLVALLIVVIVAIVMMKKRIDDTRGDGTGVGALAASYKQLNDTVKNLATKIDSYTPGLGLKSGPTDYSADVVAKFCSAVPGADDQGYSFTQRKLLSDCNLTAVDTPKFNLNNEAFIYTLYGGTNAYLIQTFYIGEQIFTRDTTTVASSGNLQWNSLRLISSTVY